VPDIADRDTGRSHSPVLKMKDLRNSITQPRLDEREQRAKARYLFRSSIAAAGTPVESYLRRRGIAVLSPSIRFLPPRKSVHHPAMLVPYGLPDEPEPSVIDIAEVAITAVQLP
jgi:hypothetical protein